MKPDYDWYIKYGHRDSFKRMWTGGKESRERLMDRVYRTIRSVHPNASDSKVRELMNQAEYRGVYEPERFAALSSVLKAIRDDAVSVPIPPSQPARVRSGRVRAQDRVLVDDSGPFVGMGISLFTAAWLYRHDRDRLDRAIAWAVKAGCNYVRIFASIDWGRHGHTAPVDVGDPGLTEETITYLYTYGLRSLLTLFTRHDIADWPHSSAPYHDPAWVVDDWARRIMNAPERYIAVEIANESDHPHNDWPDDQIRDLTQRMVDRTGGLILVAPTAGHGDGAMTRLAQIHPGSESKCTTIHYPRRSNTHERIWRAVRQPRHTAHDGRWPVPIIDSEPYNYDRESEGNFHVSAAAGMRVAAVISGCAATCLHTQIGVGWLSAGHLDDMKNADRLQLAMRLVADVLPANVANWRRYRAGQDGHPFPSTETQHWSFAGHPDAVEHEDGPNAKRGVSRAFAAVYADWRMATILTGLRGHIDLRERWPRPFRAYNLDGRSPNAIYEGTGPVTLRGDDAAVLLVTA